MALPPSFPFIVEEHIIESQHIREYPHATRTGDDVLKLAVKRYTPKSNPNPQRGDLTIIGAHGAGFPKELYEPIWEELYSRLRQRGVRIRSIWIADTANQGASGVLNEETLGNDPSWFDHARDLLCMINQFKADMPRPIVGVGHSLGAGQLTLLSLLHPRLFTSLVLIEPVIEKDIHTGKGLIFVQLSLARKDVWASRQDAEAYFNKQYRKWNPKVLERWLRYALRDICTEDGSGTAVTLATSRYQEVIQYLRPNFDKRESLSMESEASSQSAHDPIFHPDIIGPRHAIHPFYRYEPILAWKLLKHVRPSVLYLFGERSPVSPADLREEKLKRTGRGIGGSGGYLRGRVKEVTIPRAGHHLAFEEVSRVSEDTADWLKGEVDRWEEEEERINRNWVELPLDKRISVSDDWNVHLKECFNVGGGKSSKL